MKGLNCGHNSSRANTFLTRMVRPWYLNGLEKSMCSARSGLMVNGATIMSAFPLTSSPIIPFHARCVLPLRCKYQSSIFRHQHSSVFLIHSVSTDGNNNNNTEDNLYGAVIMT